MGRRRRGGGRGRGRNTRASEAAAAAAAAAAAEDSVPENEETETMETEETLEPPPEEPEAPVVETSTEEAPATEAEVEEEAGDVEMAEVPEVESEAPAESAEEQEDSEDQKEETVPQEESDAAAAASSSADSAPPSNSSSPTPGTSTSATASTSKKEKRDLDKELLNRPDCLKNLLTDKEYLIDVSAGYASDTNLKVPLKGFTADDELQLFPVIESMSAKLYNIVQRMNGEQKASVEAAIKSRRGIIRLPNMLAKAYLCHIKFLEPPGASDKPTGPTKRPPHPFLLTEDENMFSEDKLKMLRAVLDAGWKREVVMRSPGSTGRKTGDVYYYSPDGTKFRSSKQVAQHLAEIKDSPFTIDNYSFAKVRISTNPDQEIVRKAYDGKSPPRSPPKPSVPTKMKPPVSKAEAGKAPPKPSSSTSKDLLDADMRSVPEEPVKAMSSRRSIQPPKRYSGETVLLLSKRSKAQDDKRNSKGLMQMGMLPPKYPKGMEDSGNLAEGMDYDGGIQEEACGSNSVTELADDSLFQISALRQSGGIDVDNMTRLVENHNKQLAAKSAAEGAPQPEFQQQRTGMAKPGGTSVIPCSIRCPGMQGVIPTLQCTRCLCLYHAECLGLPPNLLFNKYVCSYCTDAPPPGSSQQKQLLMKKQYDAMKRAPPGLAPLMQTGMRPPHPRETMTSPMAGKEVYRLPQKVVVSSHAAPPARGIGRARGAPPHIRPPAPIHSGQRMIGPDGPTIGMVGPGVVKRGRGRPPSVATARTTVPQLNKNLTITHLPKLGSGPPPVPNLQPMGTKSIGKLALPMMGGKPRQVIPSVPNLMKPNAFRLTVPPPSLSGRTFKKMTPSIHAAPSSLRISQPATTVTKIAPTPTHHDRSVSLIKRYPQSIATIGNKKFVVLPKSGTGNAFVPPNMVGNGAIAKTNLAMDGMRNPETTIKKIEAASLRDEQVNSAGDGNPGPQKTAVRNVTATTTTAVEKPPAENVPEQMTEEPVESNDTTPMEVSTTEAEETKPLAEAVAVNQ